MAYSSFPFQHALPFCQCIIVVIFLLLDFRSNNMKALREAAKKDPMLKEEWIDGVQTPLSLISTVFRRLKWNDEDVEVF